MNDRTIIRFIKKNETVSFLVIIYLPKVCKSTYIKNQYHTFQVFPCIARYILIYFEVGRRKVYLSSNICFEAVREDYIQKPQSQIWQSYERHDPRLPSYGRPRSTGRCLDTVKMHESVTLLCSFFLRIFFLSHLCFFFFKVHQLVNEKSH